MHTIDFFKNLKLGVKVSMLGVGSVLITAVALVLLAVWQSGQYNVLAQNEVDGLINADLNHITQSVYNLVQTENEAVQQQLNGNLNVLRHLIINAGGMELASENVPWVVKNQFSGQTAEAQLPKILIGGKWLGMNTDPDVETAVVDMMAKLSGEAATIFQRMNERGDMLRIATTVKTTDDRRAIGTYIPAINPDGTANAVISNIMKDGSYRGSAFVVNMKYLTAYEPFKDKSGRIIGMIYVGVRQYIVESRVRQAVLQTSVGRTGYVYVLGGTDAFQGRYIISQRGERDGENIFNAKDSDGRYMVQSIIAKAIKLKPGELATERYRWQNPGETGLRWKIARLAYFAPWDWVIGTSVYEDELQSYRTVLSEGRAVMTNFMGLAGITITLLIGLISVFISMTIVLPVRQITKAAELITMGNFDQSVEVRSSDEIGLLASTFNFMTGKLKETMDGLRKSEEKYRVIFSNAIEGLFQASLEGRFLNANLAAANILGYDSVESLIDCVTDWRRQVYVDIEDYGKISSAILEQKKILVREVQLKRKDGLLIWVSVSACLICDDAGQPLHIQGFITNITERKRSEEELQKYREHLEEMVKNRTNELAVAKEMAESSNKAKSIFLANMSHELRTPMNVILGFANIMAQDSDITLEQKENLGLILKSGEHLLGIINSILDIAKIESGKLEAEPIDFDLGELMNNTIAMLRVRAEAKNLELVLDQSSSFPRYVHTDPAKLSQIIINLVGNAIKYTNKGKVVIKLGVSSMQTDFKQNFLYFEISDTGLGISSDNLERIFLPFMQIGRHEGTGLGLPIAQRYAQLLGGSISVESEPGKGSTFRFTVTYKMVDCCNLPNFVSQGNKIIDIENARDYRILIVEDQKENRMLLINLLSPLGFQLREASDGEEGFQAFQQWRPHLVFIDRRMPVMDGLQATVKMRELSYGGDAIIIAVTAHAFKDERQQMLDAGCNAFIAKPFAASEIFSALETYLHLRVRRAALAVIDNKTVILDPAALAELPETLRNEFESALIRLDIKQITEIIRRIASQNAGLAQTLEQYAVRLDYKPILNALQSVSGGKL